MKQMKHMKRTELADQRTANRKVFEIRIIPEP